MNKYRCIELEERKIIEEKLGHYRIIWQVHSARDFSPRQSLKSVGILYVFQAFQTAGLEEKIRRKPQTQLCGIALDFYRF